MITFMFWNLSKKPVVDLIASLAVRRGVNVLMLAECEVEAAALLRSLNKSARSGFHYAPSPGCEKIEIFTSFPSMYIQPEEEDDTLTMRSMKLPGLPEILLAVGHLPSKLFFSGSSQAAESAALSARIRRTESKVGHARTILVGDLNMNPFEDGMVNANGFHAVMSKDIAQREARTVQGQQYPFFYNPMWNILGDASLGPPGTYYYSRAEHRMFFWNVFDQVLVRPSLLANFSNDDLEIICSDGTTSLLTKNGIPNKARASDHLPILFKLAL
jgi:hypothetical protein